MTRIFVIAVLLLVPALAWGGFQISYQGSGNLGLEIAGAAGLNGVIASGNLTLNLMPPTATVVQATLYATQSNNSTGLDAVFNNVNLGTVAALATDPGQPALSTYAWDVTTHMIPAVNTYSYLIGQTAGGVNGIAGVALVVVWSDASEPNRTVVVHHGMQQVGESGAETENLNFSALPAGQATAWVFTVYDDATTTNETVLLNNNPIGGPLVANLGLNASVLSMSATTVSGTNVMGISTVTDHLGWVIGALAVDPAPTPVEPATWGGLKRRHYPGDTPR